MTKDYTNPEKYGLIIKLILRGAKPDFIGKDPREMSSYDNSVNNLGSLIHIAAGFGKSEVVLSKSGFKHCSKTEPKNYWEQSMRMVIHLLCAQN